MIAKKLQQRLAKLLTKPMAVFGLVLSASGTGVRLDWASVRVRVSFRRDRSLENTSSCVSMTVPC